MSTHPEIAHLARDERIRAIAYSLWEEEGCLDGRDQEHWLRACELIDAEAEADPNWLQRAEGEAPAEPQAVPASEPESPKTSSLDDLVKRMKGSRAA